MNKRYVIVVAVVALALVGAAGLLFLRGKLDAIVADAIATHGSRLTGTAVTVGGVDLELREGRITIAEVRVANPAGFSDRPALALGRFVLDIDPGSLRGEPYVIEDLVIGDVSVLYELDAEGHRNLDVIRANLEAAQGGEGGGDGSDAGGEAPAPRLIVDRLEVAGGTVEADASALGLDARSAELAGFTLTDLGRPDGAPAPLLGREVLQRLVDQAARAAVSGELQDQLQQLLGGEEGQDLDDAVKDKLGDLLGG